jgi:hypothetical protein
MCCVTGRTGIGKAGTVDLRVCLNAARAVVLFGLAEFVCTQCAKDMDLVDHGNPVSDYIIQQ